MHYLIILLLNLKYTWKISCFDNALCVRLSLQKYAKLTFNEYIDRIIRFFETNDFSEFKKYFNNKIGLVDDFSTLGIDLKLNLNDLIENVNLERLKNNPIKININTLFIK